MNIDYPASGLTPALKTLWHEAFGDSYEFIELFFANAYNKNRCRVVTENGEVCAALYYFDCELRGEKLAYIYAVATAEKYRGRGLCRRLMEDTHGLLKDLGYVGVILVPGSESLFSLYGSMGYKICGYVRELSCEASDESERIKRLDAAEYARLRRLYLPENGVLQEGENIAYLASFCELYAFDGGVAAVRREGARLECTELLGDASRAPAIVTSLGCKHGVFRTVGADKSFAMSVSFADIEMGDVYFGLAFD